MTPVRVRYIRLSLRSTTGVWLVLDPAPPALVGFVRDDGDFGWVAKTRAEGGNSASLRGGFADRRSAATWLLLALGGFAPINERIAA